VLGVITFAAPDASIDELVEGRHWLRARAIVESQATAHAGDARFLWRASQVKTAFGDLDGAAVLAEKAAALDPANAGYQVQLFEVYGSQAEKASLFRQASLGRKCKKAMDRALELDPKSLDALFGAMLFYYQAPGLFGGDKERARAIPAAMAAVDPVRGILAEARLAQMESRLDKLESIYLRAVAAGPAHYDARVALANFYLSAKPNQQLALAEKHALEAVRLHPDRAWPYAIAASSAALAGRAAEAVQYAERAAGAVPDNLGPQLAAAGILISQGRNLASAEAWCRQYLARPAQPDAPPHAIAHWRLAQALAAQGKRDAAGKSIAEAARLLPKHPGIQADRARLTAAAGL
jgi:tetratricopeptide (TPR) repeat protein